MGDSLEDLRSKIIASMGGESGGRGQSNSADRREPQASTSGTVVRDKRRETRSAIPQDRYAKRYSNRGPERPHESGGGRYDQGSRYQPHTSRYSTKPQQQQTSHHQSVASSSSSRERYQGSGRRSRQQEIDWDSVVPIDQWPRRRPSRWDVTPSGFENVPAERAKLSGLFPLPSQPQGIDRSKLEGIVANGVLTRRTAILFEDSTETNMKLSKYNKMLVLTAMDLEFKQHDSVVNYLTRFARLVDDSATLVKHSLKGLNLVLEFSSDEITTIVLSCQEYIERELNHKFIWQRPQEYVQREYECSEPTAENVCSPNVVSLQGIPETDESGIEKYLEGQHIKYKWSKPIFITEGDGVKTFIGTVLVEPAEEIQAPTELAVIRPNKSKLVQRGGEMTFQTLPKLVVRAEREASKVIELLNCVDPMDLKNEVFLREIRESIENSSVMRVMGELESVKIPVPSADYRNSFDTIGTNVGKIFVKFKEIGGAERAMKSLPGRRFNDRTMLCSYFSERDYDMDVF